MSGDRGFIAEWNPQRKTRILVNQVQQILTEYEDELPLTLRQIFYRLVAQFDFEKTESGYTKLLNAMAKARRAQYIRFDSIRDDGFYNNPSQTFDSVESAADHFLSAAASVRVDRQIGQDQKLVLWCEARGMVPTIESIADQYSIAVHSSGGFDSLTAKRNFGKQIAGTAESGLQTVVLHIGDFDPSGVVMFSALREDVWVFAKQYNRESDPQFVRLALTPEQIEQHNLPSAPAKKSTHSKNFVGETVQLEALDPRQLRSIVRESIESYLDLDIYQQQLDREQQIRAELTARLSGE